jgi:hypothetical protein
MQGFTTDQKLEMMKLAVQAFVSTNGRSPEKDVPLIYQAIVTAISTNPLPTE